MKEYSIYGLDTECGLKNVNYHEDVYHRVLDIYCRESVEKLKIYSQVREGFLQDNLLKTTIDMHGIKGASDSIGALDLGEKFRKMELAGKEGNIAFLSANMESCMSAYKSLVDEIRMCLLADEKQSAGEIDKEEAYLDSRWIDEMIALLDNIEFDKFEETIGQLLEQNFGTRINHSLKESWRSYDHFDYEDATNILKQLKG